jgi:hypothetical protein
LVGADGEKNIRLGKANFQAYIDPAGEVMEETIHGRGRHRGEVG